MPVLQFKGKSVIETYHHVVPHHRLEFVPKLSVLPKGTRPSLDGNLIIEGDNLLALKALLPTHAGKVKCIYIDPPYNTGNENWVYNDAVNSPEMRDWLGKVVGGEAEDLSRHDKWLCMMYPRLQLLRQFLRQDGAIFISIDDNESHYLKMLVDEIFGRRNFVANIVWQKRTSPDMRLAMSDGHEHVLLFAKSADGVRLNRVPKTAKQVAQYKNTDGDPRGPWVSSDYTAQGYRPNQMYTIRTPGGVEHSPPPGVCWKNVESVFLELLKDGRIWFGKDGKGMPRRKTFLSESEGNAAWTWWPNEEVGHTQEAKKEIASILGGGGAQFDTPKPVRLITRILQIATDKDSLVLDSFAGSGTTGHAVLALNKEDGGSRRFILVEMDPRICRSVTAQRLTNAATGYKPKVGNGGQEVPGLGGGFRYCTLAEPLFNAEGRIRETVRFSDLAAHVFFTATGRPLPNSRKQRSPLLGVHEGTAVYLLYNGILKDKSANGGNALTRAVLERLPAHDGLKVVYGTSCRLGKERLRRERIAFRQIPYELRIR
jgi:site-specific DNA-methyltransferase (adenine-specific)/adenine-specific DNA-methyltransferase